MQSALFFVAVATLGATGSMAQVGPGTPTLVGELESVDAEVKAEASRARDAAARDASQRVADDRRRSGRNRAVPATLADLVVGAPVHDDGGIALGTIRSVDGTTAVVTSGASAVGIPVDAFGKNRKGLMLALGKAEFDALVAAAR